MIFHPTLIIFIWREISKRLVRSNCVVDQIPLFQLLIMFLQFNSNIFDFIELFSMCSIGPLHLALQLQTSRRDDKEPNAAVLAGCFEVFFELGSAIDLDG